MHPSEALIHRVLFEYSTLEQISENQIVYFISHPSAYFYVRLFSAEEVRRGTFGVVPRDYERRIH